MYESEESTDDEALQFARHNSEAHADAGTHAQVEAEPSAETGAYANANANADRRMDAEANADADADAIAKANGNAGADTKVNAEANEMAAAEADAGANASAGAKETAGTDASADAGAVADADAEARPDARTAANLSFVPPFLCNYSKSVYPTHTAPPAPLSASRGAGPLDSVRPLTRTRNAHQGHGDPTSAAHPGYKVGTDPRGAGVCRSNTYAATSPVAATPHHAHAEAHRHLLGPNPSHCGSTLGGTFVQPTAIQ